VSTGSQGEPLSAPVRMAKPLAPPDPHRGDDTVVLASSAHPGQRERDLPRHQRAVPLGRAVVHKGVARVHVSGHASAGELLYLLNATRPSNVMPVHGEWRHLRAHAELARLTGVPADRIVLAEDGVVVDLVDGKAEITGAVECGYVFVDGLEVGDVGESTLKDRRILGDEGFISITVASTASAARSPVGPRSRPAASATTGRPSTPCWRSSRPSSRGRPPRGSSTPTSWPRPCAGWPGAGSATPTAAAR
jgi:ribonuclease J